MTEEKLVFFYGTLTFNVDDTEMRFPVEYISDAVAQNVAKYSNNVLPEANSEVEGMLFYTESWTELDGFEEPFGYERVTVSTHDGHPVDFYTTVPQEFEDSDLEVTVEEQ